MTHHGTGKSSFNSRPHKEVDIVFLQVYAILLHLSTHDLTRRSTHFTDRYWMDNTLSTHDLTRRSTLLFRS